MKDRSIRLVPLNDGSDGYEVLNGHFVGYVYPDWFGGWRPYSYYGQCMTSGRRSCFTPITAAHYFEQEPDNDRS